MRNWLHRFVVVVPLLAILCVTATTTAFAARYTYDAASIARVDAHTGGGSGSGSAQFSGAQVASASPHTEARGTSTTQLPRSVATEAATPRETLFHYTDEAGQNGILDSGQLNPSLKSVNPADARYGNGQYLSDVQPGSMSCAQLSRCFLGQPFQGSRFTNYVEIDVTGLDVIKGRPGVFVNPSETPLDLTGRIVSWGRN